MKVLWFANTPCGASEILNPGLNIGGWLKSLEDELVKQDNVELSVCFYWNTEMEPFKYNQTTYYPVYRPRLYYIVSRIFNYTNDGKYVEKLIKVIENVKPKVIHIHGTEDNFGLVQKHSKIPTLVSIQGILSPYCEKFFAGIPAFSVLFNESLKRIVTFNSELLYYKRFKKQAHREREILHNTKYIFGRTAWDKRITSVLAPERNYFLGNEMLRQSFYDAQWSKNKPSSPLKIVTIMSGGIYKGIETVVKTVKILSLLKEMDYTWTIIGQTEQDILPKMIKRWLTIDYKKLKISLLGSKNENQIIDILLASDIYCQVSHIENSPNSVCEAMLLGIPIIASFAGGTDSMLENGKEGLLVQDGDPYSLAGAIVEMQLDFDRAILLGQNARKAATERHNKYAIVNGTLRAYQSISGN